MTKKWFTLVEMLIVVVIIGILIAALVPRLMWAQEKARDVARGTSVWQIHTALNLYYETKGAFPDSTWGVALTCAWTWFGEVLKQYLTDVPRDPLSTRVAYWTVATNWCWESWMFGYLPLTNQGSANGWFVLIANTEAIWKTSNWVLQNNYMSAVSFKASKDATTTADNDPGTDNVYIFDNVETARWFMCLGEWVSDINVANAEWWLSKDADHPCSAKENNQMVMVKFN